MERSPHASGRLRARATPEKLPERLQQYLSNAQASLVDPFTGITTGGAPVRGLFPIAPTGVSTQGIKDAAAAFVASLGVDQKRQAVFPLDDEAWRRWSNIHPHLMRHGVMLDALTPAQRERGLALVSACLSERGFTTVRDVMKLNHYYRIHRPVILVEFDHQRGIALDDDQPSRDHIHTVVRTPNGNDYGKDLLRQHYERFDHSRGVHDAPR